MTFKPIETQEQLDEIVKARVARAEESAKKKYADYDELKRKAEAYDKAQEDAKSDAEKYAERLAKLENDAKAKDDAAKRKAAADKVAKETGVPAELLTGADEEAMRASADAINGFAKKATPPAPIVPGAGTYATGAKAADEDAELRKFANELFGKSE